MSPVDLVVEDVSLEKVSGVLSVIGYGNLIVEVGWETGAERPWGKVTIPPGRLIEVDEVAATMDMPIRATLESAARHALALAEEG